MRNIEFLSNSSTCLDAYHIFQTVIFKVSDRVIGFVTSVRNDNGVMSDIFNHTYESRMLIFTTPVLQNSFYIPTVHKVIQSVQMHKIEAFWISVRWEISTVIIRNSWNMYIRTVHSVKSVSVKKTGLRKNLIKFMKQILKSSRKNLWSSLNNSWYWYHFRIKIVKIHKFFAKCLTSHSENKSHCFWERKLTFSNEVSLRIDNKSWCIFLHAANKSIKLAFDDITVFLHGKTSNQMCISD